MSAELSRLALAEAASVPDGYVVRTYNPFAGVGQCTGPFADEADAWRVAVRLTAEMAVEMPGVRVTVEPLYADGGAP